MEWSRPTQQGEIPSPRAGHAGATIGESWFITGGGDNKTGTFSFIEVISLLCLCNNIFLWLFYKHLHICMFFI